jgi:hypothetical protein
MRKGVVRAVAEAAFRNWRRVKECLIAYLFVDVAGVGFTGMGTGRFVSSAVFGTTLRAFVPAAFGALVAVVGPGVTGVCGVVAGVVKGEVGFARPAAKPLTLRVW